MRYQRYGPEQTRQVPYQAVQTGSQVYTIGGLISYEYYHICVAAMSGGLESDCSNSLKLLTGESGIISLFETLTNKPQHDKNNKMSVRPAKTRISLGIRPVWSESLVSAWRKIWSWAAHSVHSEDSDPSLWCPHEERLGPELPIQCTAKTLIRLGGCQGWSVSSLDAQKFCWFCHEAAQMTKFVQLRHTVFVKCFICLNGTWNVL